MHYESHAVNVCAEKKNVRRLGNGPEMSLSYTKVPIHQEARSRAILRHLRTLLEWCPMVRLVQVWQAGI